MPENIQTPTTQSLSIDKIKSAPHQARRQFDETSLQELAASLKERGLKQPILVRLLADGAPELVAGERRLRAAMHDWGQIQICT